VVGMKRAEGRCSAGSENPRAPLTHSASTLFALTGSTSRIRTVPFASSKFRILSVPLHPHSSGGVKPCGTTRYVGLGGCQDRERGGLGHEAIVRLYRSQ